MNWDAVGAIGQAISALALVVVIVQVRLSTTETLRSIRQSRTDDERRTQSDDARSEWLCHVLAKGMKAYGIQLPYQVELMERGLTAEEAVSFNNYLSSWWLSDQQNITHIDMLSKEDRAAFDARMLAMYRSSEVRSRFLEFNRPILNPQAVRYIDDLLAQ